LCSKESCRRQHDVGVIGSICEELLMHHRKQIGNASLRGPNGIVVRTHRRPGWSCKTNIACKARILQRVQRRPELHHVDDPRGGGPRDSFINSGISSACLVQARTAPLVESLQSAAYFLPRSHQGTEASPPPASPCRGRSRSAGCHSSPESPTARCVAYSVASL